MNAKALLELAERCEKATGPDRALDVAIAVAVDWRWPDWEEGESTAAGQAAKHGLDWLTDRAINGMASMWRHMPVYTSSLDAAMSLLPEGWVWTINTFPDSASAYTMNARNQQLRTKAATPALALTAACLKAITAQGDDR